ncbi:Bcnem1 [Botrytis cinerea B05.10]|uniref:Bcnem1 n=2 Tax=Botryotinia fuckeliana TaxID=40559 RepID=A0A384JEC3_BOTFB|nr:Bcnem1 [Botrytis cinerea B05.10]ATZ48949.1 Bcnem1 [Botrytis cinerea B05.10]EMR87040.1 putative nuclear envelope morphology protein 1 protein [Botrytis cinerea BcDW1]
MNSLNILSGRGSPTHSPSLSRSNSLGNVLASVTTSESRRNSREEVYSEEPKGLDQEDAPDSNADDDNTMHESIPLLHKEGMAYRTSEHVGITRMFYDSIRWVLSTLVAPGVYVIACLYDERGNFAPIFQFRKLFGGTTGHSITQSSGGSPISEKSSIGHLANGKLSAIHAPASRDPPPSSSSFISSESESDNDRLLSETDDSATKTLNRQTRSKSLQSSDEISPARRSIRIKLHNDENLRQRKHRKASSTTTQSDGSGGSMSATDMAAAMMKSPTSPATSSLLMTKYPRAPAPPRPLIPRRQPSYTLDAPVGKLTQKTLILDLDETLIHSMNYGGRMSAGHMVEVQITNLMGAGGAGPQHPILYYVNKRPYCDEFLRRVCKWYNLVVFTASLQDYADPVIDWLEQERKFFSARYYRQHCTYRNGAFIKDLSSVEPDLSKVMILDNSPVSYLFHQDNAIPIEGWINDPTDNDLLHLVPLLEGLQYVTDVRAFLALRGGEDGKHMTS